jgi:hypothetical protein
MSDAQARWKTMRPFGSAALRRVNMGKVAQVRTSDNTCGTYQRPSRKEVSRMLSCGHSPASIASCYGMSLRDVRRIAKRVSA